MPKPTYYAKLLADELEKRGIQTKLEYHDGHKSVDIFIPSVKIDLEIDGRHHADDSHQALTDLKRTKYSLKEGRQTIRIANSAIYENVAEVADNILEIIEDIESKNKKERLKELTKKPEINQSKSNPVIFYYDKPKKKKHKKIIFILIAILIISILIFFNNYNSQEKDIIQNNPAINQNTIQPKKTIEPVIVSSSKTDVIIKNNQPKSLSLNVTYRIYSSWFNKDLTESKIFKINAKEEKSFKVYNNDGCVTAPCSISILNFKEV